MNIMDGNINCRCQHDRRYKATSTGQLSMWQYGFIFILCLEYCLAVVDDTSIGDLKGREDRPLLKNKLWKHYSIRWCY